jgi:hypothetical protein
MRNLSQASKAATLKNKISQLSTLGVEKSQFTVESALTVLETAAGEFIQQILDNIEKADIITTGSITDIRAEVDEQDQTVSITAPIHFFFQSEGVNGTQVQRGAPFSFSGRYQTINIDAVRKWIRDKGIKPKDPKTSEEAMAYLIARSIYREGIEPKDLYQSDLDRFIDNSANRIADWTIKVII